jgi:hypothetical protein
MSYVSRLLTTLSVLTLSACAATFTSSWKAPDATPLEFKGAKVVAVVMMKDQASRRTAEDTLASEITKRGGNGIAMYTLLPDIAPANEAATRAAIEKAGVQGVVVLRPINVDKELVVTSNTSMDPMYRGYWGGYYGYGGSAMWAAPVDMGSTMSTNTIVSVETLVYSLKQNKLVWSGKSKTTNPPELIKFVKKLAADAAKELEKQGLLKG